MKLMLVGTAIAGMFAGIIFNKISGYFVKRNEAKTLKKAEDIRKARNRKAVYRKWQMYGKAFEGVR